MKSFHKPAVLSLALSVSADAFVGPAKQVRSVIGSEKFVQTKQSSDAGTPLTGISYGEESRKYRRTVYTHDDWVKHRSSDRFIRNIKAFTASGVYKNLAREVVATTSIALFIVIYNCLVGGYVDFGYVQHAPLVSSPYLPVFALPLAPFTLASPSLGLLLGKCITYD